MPIRFSFLSVALAVSSVAVLAQAPAPRTPAAASAPTAIPALVPDSGTALGADGKPPGSDAHITFLIFKEEQGGEPLWTESQFASVDSAGHYKVQLGAANPNGLPSDLFATGEARWLEVQVAGEKPQPRVLLASVPYALKAADAATLGGLPASAFALAGSASFVGTPASGAEANLSREAAATVTTTGGTANNLAVFSGANTVISSILIDNGVGIGVGKPPSSSAILDVNGPTILRGDVQLQRTGNATTSTGYNSHQFNFTAQAWDSSTKGVVSPTFQWRAEPINNNTASPSATWNLLTTNGVANAAETGLYVNANGTIHFASGQTFGSKSSSGVAFNGTSSSNTGVEGTSSSAAGVSGTSTTGDGVTGSTSGGSDPASGVVGRYVGYSYFGYVFAGVWGDSDAHDGVDGTSNSSVGVSGDSDSNAGVVGFSNSNTGVYGVAAGNTFTLNTAGVYGVATVGNTSGFGGISGVWGDATSSVGVFGSSDHYAGVEGQSAAGSGIQGNSIEGVGVRGSSEHGAAGQFNGDVHVTGVSSAGAQASRIDHPSDPANKYLVHTSIESSEMVNLYSGNVTTDELGLATVQLPDWFEVENTDFRYQLTIVGRKAQSWISQEIKGGKFQIASDATNTKVSWLITCVRQDAFAKAHPLVVEEAKPVKERGFYLHPELYGQPQEKQTDWANDPEGMRQMQTMRTAKKTAPMPSRVPVAKTRSVIASRETTTPQSR